LGFIASIVYSDLYVEQKLDEIKGVKPVPGIPIYPQLVQRVGSFEEVFERYPQGIFLQPKYDGLRLQMHFGINYVGEGVQDRVWAKFLKPISQEKVVDLFSEEKSLGSVKLFSRNLQDLTEMFPELIAEVYRIVEQGGFKNFILDGEVVGLKNGNFIPFQDIMLRKRKYNVASMSKRLPATYFVFDVLLLDDQVLIGLPFAERQKYLDRLFGLTFNHIRKTPTSFVENMKQLRNLFNEDVKKGLEGVVLKIPNGPYLPGVRNYSWIKLKKSIEGVVVDTIDGVILGFYYLSGKKYKEV
jgi:DNA ligase-1